MKRIVSRMLIIVLLCSGISAMMHTPWMGLADQARLMVVAEAWETQPAMVLESWKRGCSGHCGAGPMIMLWSQLQST